MAPFRFQTTQKNSAYASFFCTAVWKLNDVITMLYYWTMHASLCFNCVLMFNFYVWKQEFFSVTIMKWRISGQEYKHLTRFSKFVLFKPTASTMQKIYSVGCFRLCHWRFVHIHIFSVIWRKSSKSDFQSWIRNSRTISLFFRKMIA